MNRHPDWPTRLTAYIAQHRSAPFAWGVHDCCQFARGGVKALRDSDPAAALKLRAYSTERGAAAQLARLGGVAAIPAKCSFLEIPVTRAGRGDVVMKPFEGRETLGLCAGHKSVFPGPTGLVFVPTLECTRAWKN